MFNVAHPPPGRLCTPEVLSVSWQDFDDLMAFLADRITREGLPDLIVALERGGLVPAVALSHRLGVRSLLPVPVQRTTSDAVYAQKHAPHVRMERCDRDVITGRDVLVVDDIVGTGQSLQAVVCALTLSGPGRLRSAVSLVNRHQWDTQHTEEPAQCITYIGREVRGWVIFPWEKQVDDG